MCNGIIVSHVGTQDVAS